MAVRVIVNADDLGISDEVNKAIFDGMERGVVTSATILANGPALMTAVRDLHRFPRCSFGSHLNLTEFEPLLAASRHSLASIIDERGCFNGNAIREVTVTPSMLAGIFREWCAQIERLINLGVRPSHLDAHHHVHTIPQMLPVLAAVRQRFRINKVRISRNFYPANAPAPRSLLIKKQAYNFALKAVGFQTTEVFTDLETFTTRCGSTLPSKTKFELMTHPGADNGREPELLRSDWRQQVGYPVRLVSYNSL